MKDAFRKIANKISAVAGSATAFLFAILIIVIWATSGPAFNFSDTWQLVINTSTTIVTFLMVFLIQNTQNRDTKAVQLKLDELIRATHARNTFLNLENFTDEELQALDGEFTSLREKQSANALMRKLHAQIAKERTLRVTIGSSTGQLLNKLNPLNSLGNLVLKTDKNKKDKNS